MMMHCENTIEAAALVQCPVQVVKPLWLNRAVSPTRAVFVIMVGTRDARPEICSTTQPVQCWSTQACAGSRDMCLHISLALEACNDA